MEKIVTPLEKIVEVYWNHEGRFELEASYAVFADWELAQMTDEERAAVPTEIPVSLYDDLLVPVEDIFLNVGVYG